LLREITPKEGQLTLEPVAILQNHQFVRGLTGQQLESLAAHAAEVDFEENEIILVEGEHSSFFYLLVSGSVAIDLRTSRYSVCVEALGPGQVFGWSSLLDHQDTLFQVRAREHSSALRIDGATMQRLCREDPLLGTEILRRTLQVVAGRVKATEQRFAEMCGVRI
jgi:CRP/FNR family transcriptional regulator, cyclic AMP receptor protein